MDFQRIMMLWFAQAQFVEQCVFDYFDTLQQSHAINFAKGLTDQRVTYLNEII